MTTEIDISNRQLTHARLGGLTGRKAIHRLLNLHRGTFTIEHVPEPFTNAFDPETADILTLVERHHDLGAILDSSTARISKFSASSSN